MSENKGCLKKTLIGCGGLLAVVVLVIVVASTLMMRTVSKRQDVEPVLAPLAETVVTQNRSGERSLEIEPPAGKSGRVVLVLSQGEFTVEPAAPGEGPRAEARFDPEFHEFVETYELLADSTWVYKVGFRQTKSGFAALMQTIFGDKVDARVEIFLPTDWPLELDFQGEEGGCEMELGGLWLTDADIRFRKGGITMDFDEPLREPMRHLILKTTMGGCEAEGIGNASPRFLLVNCGMGGASLDMYGDWQQPCDADFTVTMGGVAVMLPDDIDAKRVERGDRTLVESATEIPGPALTYSYSAKMGEVEIVPR